MLKNYLVTIFRQIQKNKVFSFINIFGLALGMAACLVIAQYVSFHSSFDEFHENADQIFRIESIAFKDGEELGQAIKVPLPLGVELLNTTPEVGKVARFYDLNYANSTAKYKDGDDLLNFKQNKIYTAEKSTFDIFSVNFLAGNGNRFDEPYKAIMSSSNAVKFFSDPESAIGEKFTLSGNTGSEEYELVGIVEDLPDNSHLEFELLISHGSIKNYTDENSWGYNASFTYVLIDDISKKDKVLADAQRILEENGQFEKAGYSFDLFLQPLKDIHLGTLHVDDFRIGVDMITIVSLSIIAVIILVIAWINYMNLSLVRTIERVKEMGIRKCMGSSIKQITGLFIMEAFIMNILALGLAIIVTQIFEKYLINITGLPTTELLNISVLSFIAAIMLVGTVIIGFYPYAILKAINIANVLVGKKGKVGGTKLRKSLVFVQFMITFILISGTLTVYNQTNFMRNADLKIDIENVLVIQAPPGDINNRDRAEVAKFNTLQTELLKYSGIPAIATGGERPGAPISWGTSIYLKNGNQEGSVPTNLISMSVNFPEFFDIDLVAGRALKRGDDPWSKGDVVINEKLAEMLGFSNPEDAIGEDLSGFYAPLTVRGVLENHHHTSLHSDFTPIAYIISGWNEYYFVKLRLDENSTTTRSEQLENLVATVNAEWDKVFDEYTMDYFFLDSSFDEQYKEDLRFGKIFSGFSTIAIVIACLGLFGLTSFTIQQRTKEIGIRKVLGASFDNLMLLLSKEYLLLVLIACIVSIPVSWWLMNLWLDEYTFRIGLGWWFYTIPVFFILSLAFLSVISRVLNTIRTNPVESLRYE